MEPNIIVAIIGAVILLSVFLTHFSKRTGWPLILLLLIIGVLVGPVFNLINVQEFQNVIHSFAIIALVIVLFDAGYDIKINKIRRAIFESTGLALIGVISTIAVIFLISKYLLGFNNYLSILFGTLLASTDLTIIFPLMRSIKLDEKVKDALNIEATLNSVFAAIIAIVSATVIVYNTTLIEAVSRGLIYHVMSGIAIGLVLGWILLKGLHHLSFDDMPAIVTIGSVLFIYAVAELIGASGVIAALIVGVIYGNVRPAPPKFIALFGENLQTILVTFIYILLGAMVTFDAFINDAFTVVILIPAIILVRYFAVKIVMLRDSLLAQRVIGISGPRGIISAVLILSYAYLFPNPNLIISLGFAVILCTSLVVFLLPIIEKRTLANKV